MNRTARARLRHYQPYNRQAEFHTAGRYFRERLLIAGNQLGKTLAGAAETAMHLTGQYPDWWRGRRFDRAITAIVGSESAELTREGVQRLLIGPPAEESAWGTGFVPVKALGAVRRRQGVAAALDMVSVRHASGAWSTLLLKSYDQGRSKWQAATADFIWLDEEPAEDIYLEALTRTNARQDGALIMTFTPLKGASNVVLRFLNPGDGDDGRRARSVTTMVIEDAEHISAEDRARIIASYPAHEREARARGVPVLGSGRVFPIPEEDIRIDPLPAIPPHWPEIVGIDFGWDHPFAAARLAHDRDNDVVHVVGGYRQSETVPTIHAAAIKAWGGWQPVAWPHDGLAHDKGSGETLAAQYRASGLSMTPARATWPDGSSGFEAGILEMLERMQSGRLKIWTSAPQFFEEMRTYHRENGLVVKVRDDFISAVRYGLMMLRFAQTRPRPRPTAPARARVV